MKIKAELKECEEPPYLVELPLRTDDAEISVAIDPGEGDGGGLEAVVVLVIVGENNGRDGAGEGGERLELGGIKAETAEGLAVHVNFKGKDHGWW
jgi:hypothetical protein